MADLQSLPFTTKALNKAQEYGHTAEMYEGIAPQSKSGEISSAQVAEVERRQSQPAASDLEPIDAGDWNGYPNYGCPYCDMLSLDRNRVREHAVRAHSRALTRPTQEGE